MELLEYSVAEDGAVRTHSSVLKHCPLCCVVSFLVDRSTPGFSTANKHIDKCGVYSLAVSALRFARHQWPVHAA